MMHCIMITTDKQSADTHWAQSWLYTAKDISHTVNQRIQDVSHINHKELILTEGCFNSLSVDSIRGEYGTSPPTVRIHHSSTKYCFINILS